MKDLIKSVHFAKGELTVNKNCTFTRSYRQSQIRHKLPSFDCAETCCVVSCPSAEMINYSITRCICIICKFAVLSPNLITPTFTETSPRGKSWTQIMKVADTNRLDMSRCLRQSPQQSPRQFPDKVADLSRTQIMKVVDVICVANFYDLCPQQVRDFVGNL